MTPEYIKAIGIPIRRGRPLAEEDDKPGVPVILINETMAQRCWPGADPIGKRIALLTGPETFSKWMKVVGVVGNVRFRGVRIDPEAELFVPLTGGNKRMFLVVHSTTPPIKLISSIRNLVKVQDNELPLGTVQTMDDLRAEFTNPTRVSSILLLASGMLALALSMLGLYGILSYMVTQRTHEMGLRAAMGASSGDIMRMVLGGGLKLAACGVALGIAGAWGMSRLLSNQLFGTNPTDPFAMIGACSTAFFAALFACYGPAQRAARLDPVVALRRE